MTPNQGVKPKVGGPIVGEIDWTNFRRACRLAEISGVTTVLLTSKGEPTLWPDYIFSYLRHLKSFGFPFVELQTNGIVFDENPDFAWELRDEGVSTVALSAVSIDIAVNCVFYSKHYPELTNTIKTLHDAGLSVRLTLMMVKGIVDSIKAVDRVIDFCRANKVEQLTIRPITTPYAVGNQEVYDWTHKNAPDPEKVKEIYEHYLMMADDPVFVNVARVLTLAHGAPVLSVEGQNLCLTDCLTVHPEGSEEMRQIIFFPDGHIRYDWQFEGAILL
jgi:pyruvate-formate lyase-activating enzyme